MKTKISHLGRSTVSVILAVMMLLSTMLIGTVSTVNASTINKGYIYFKVPDTWTTKSYVYLGLKQDNDYIHLTKMSPITNSGLYYAQAPDHSAWHDEEVLFLATSDSWGSGNLDLSKTAHYTKSIKQSTEDGKYYYFTSSDNLSTNASVSCSSDTSASTIKCDQTVNVKMMASDGSYVDNTNAGNKVELNAYYLSSNDAVAQSKIDNITSSSKYEGAVKTTSVTLKVANTAAEYSFDGWYASDGNLLSKELEYSYVVSDSANVEARFKKLTDSVADNVTLEANPTSVKVGNSVTLTPTVSGAKSNNLTYTYNKISGGTATEVKNADNSLTVTPTAAGTYEYTVTVSDNGYSDVTSAKVTITASYTATQQAYVDLETYVKSVEGTSSGSYTEESYAAFSTALTSAKDLLTGGLPDADDTDAEKYTTALDNLTAAYKNLKSNKQYYILGHKAITGDADTSSATTHDKGILMKDNGNGDYTYTFSSSNIDGNNNNAFIFIDSSNNIYSYNDANSIRVDTINSLADSVEATKGESKIGMFYFGNYTGGTKKYTIHLNTAIEGKYKVWVEVTFGLRGSQNIELVDGTKLSWDTYSESASFTADNNYTLKFYAKGGYPGDNGFRFIDSNLTYYGPDNDTVIDLTNTDTYTTVKGKTSLYRIKKSDKPYTITLTNPGETPPTFKVTQGTQYSVTVANNIANGKISVDKENPYEDDIVTVTATPDSDYVLETVTFNGKSANVVGNKATFKMPNEDVTVTATFRRAKEYTVTIAKNITNGTVKANGSSKTTTVIEGNSVTLVATPNDSCSFSSWSIKPEDGYTHDGSMTSATETIYPTNNITVSASFTQGTVSENHFLALGVSDSIGDWTDGAKTYSSKDENDNDVYTAYLDTSLFKEKTWYRFAVTKKSPTSDDRLGPSDLYDNDSNITVNGSTGSYEGDNVNTERKDNNQNYFGMFQYSGELVSLSISYNVGTKNYQVTPVIKVHNGAMLYAKNGSCRTDNQYANDMHTKGTTTISYDKTKYEVDIDDKSSTSYQLAYLSEDNIKDEIKLTITTKVTDSENYYLAGWCVDGETYLPKKTSNTENNEYSFDYYVKSTTKLTDKIEVTPVYFYKKSTDTETVRFYVTGFDDTVKKDWGNTIAVYPYYSDSTDGDVFSNYPGQPMLVSGGRYYVDLPIKYKGGRIAGVTLNNYYFDDVHKNLVSDNRQTYDYNDFLKIYEQKIEGSTGRKSQEIIFSFKYVPSDTSGHDNFGCASTNKGSKDKYPQTISAEDMEKVYKNGWEDLTDFYGNKVDLYNQKVDASTDAGKKNPWRVISNGYEQTYFGYYATRWAVYKPVEETGKVTSYSLVDVISSSSLLYNSYEDISKDETKYTAGDQNLSASSDAKAYQAFKDAHAKGVPVKITYEQTIEREQSIENQPEIKQKAFRNDGRWYYSEDNLDVTAHTVIEYADTLDDFSGTLGTNFRRDYYQDNEVDYTKAGYDSSQCTGQITKTSAYFTNKDYYQKTEANGQTGSGNTFNIIANTDHTSQYIFVGWYLLSEGKYSPLTSTVENSVSVPQDNNDVYVARFIKAPSGSLTISHKLHPNATGLGECYVSVDVLNKTGAVIHHYDETTSDITVSNEYIKYGKGNEIKITLKTVPGEATTFTDFYSYSSEFVKLVNTQTGVVPAVKVTKDETNKSYKAEISFNVDYLFDQESTGYQQKIKVLNYYSQLSLGEVNYEIRYTFTTRLYGPKVYKVSGTLTKEDIDTYHCTKTELSKSFVMAKAPFESNFKEKITWDSDKITIGPNKADGTLTAAITATQVEDRKVTATFRVDSESEAETITTDFGNRFFKKDGSYISAKATGTTAEVDGLPVAYKNTEGGNFSFWYVMTTNKEFVTKAYGQNFAYTGYDNYIVVAVYGVDGTHKDTATNSSINFLQYSRNHWNDTVSGNKDHGSYNLAGTQYDRLYADFNLMFNHNGYLLNKYSGTPNIKVGYAMVVGSKTDGDYIVDETELKKAISEKATNGGNVEHQSTSLTAKQAVKVTGSDNDDVKKNVIVNSIRIADLDNKNRITSYYGFKNSEANQSYYVKVYSYVIVGDQVTLSDTPVVINLKDIGTKTYEPQQ